MSLPPGTAAPDRCRGRQPQAGRAGRSPPPGTSPSGSRARGAPRGRPGDVGHLAAGPGGRRRRRPRQARRRGGPGGRGQPDVQGDLHRAAQGLPRPLPGRRAARRRGPRDARRRPGPCAGPRHRATAAAGRARRGDSGPRPLRARPGPRRPGGVRRLAGLGPSGRRVAARPPPPPDRSALHDLDRRPRRPRPPGRLRHLPQRSGRRRRPGGWPAGGHRRELVHLGQHRARPGVVLDRPVEHAPGRCCATHGRSASACSPTTTTRCAAELAGPADARFDDSRTSTPPPTGRCSSTRRSRPSRARSSRRSRRGTT